MERNKECDDERRALVSSENSAETQEINGRREEEEDDEEAPSLCDLPLIHQWRNEINEEYTTPSRANCNENTDYYHRHHHQEDFNFCSLSKESKMCSADEVFYQGQILPLRRSLSSRKGFLQYCSSISRSESMDHNYFSGGGLISSRSSSTSSHQSSTSGSGSSAATDHPKLPPRNQFHSHPSPSPKLQFPRDRINNRNCTKKSSLWDVLRLGLVAAPPEIAFHDFKTRSSSKNILDSRNGNNSSSSSSSGDKKKSKPWDFPCGCKCSVDAVDAVPSKVVIIKRSASDSVSQIRAVQAEEESSVARKSPKKRLSHHHHRTFEWLKQLSVQGTADEPA